jgi:hypothetical protein
MAVASGISCPERSVYVLCVAILSLPLVHKAEEIEKLAKQIKNLAKS